ncbi:hypothetical protein ACIQ1D_23275 [Lysinibacillus xylanilyticus]
MEGELNKKYEINNYIKKQINKNSYILGVAAGSGMRLNTQNKVAQILF